MKIVPVTENDWASLKNIRLESLRESPDAFGITYQEAKEVSEEKWRSISSGESGLKFFLARSENKNVGLVGGVQTAGEYELVSMWVKPEKRNGGIGTSLIKELLVHAKSEGFAAVILSVSSKNKAALNLYAKNGFKEFKESGGSAGTELKKMVWSSASEP
ncbi:GNAT family N-acetyltransferase [Microbulbifer sp.]|uniref:GNAT family N-acetyltransferase n=1 Tax=Microbulbifer sp. TaxID=1908541 RepID=UPI0025867E0C|nr:GNAT family N-acetyltransferase [Microbulbifer sp.]